MKNAILLIVVIYIGINLFALLAANKLIFFPPKSGYQDSSTTIKITTKSGATISAVYLQNPKARYTLLISHGNAEDIGYMQPFLETLNNHGFSVFAYDYEGYGTSSGTPTEKHSYQDVNAAYAYLINKLHTPAKHIILYGISVGSAVAIDLASRRPVAGVIAQSPFVSAFRVVTNYKILLFDKFDNINKIDRINCPILIIHGTADRIVPIWHGKKLYKRAKQPKFNLWVKGAGHNNLMQIAGNKFWHALFMFSAYISNE